MPEAQEHGQSLQKQPRKGGILSLRRLIFLAVMIFLAVTRLAGPGDIAFVIFSYVYVCLLLGKLAFPAKKMARKGRLSDPNNKLFRAYFISTAIIGLLFPICYIAEGMFNGDKEAIKAAGPHLFLLAGQAFMEPIGFSQRFSLPIGILIPIFYNARRIFSLVDWVKCEFTKTEPMPMRRLYAGRVLASVNMALWCYNLFGLLLPVYLPRACKHYFTQDKEN